MNTYSDCCGSCEYLDINDYVYTKDHCKCTKRGFYRDLSDEKCYAHKPARKRDYRELARRWYIVTAIFDELDLTDKYECITKLLDFRIKFVEKDPRYSNVLKDYDIVGPKLANLISSDEDSSLLCRRLCQTFLTRVFGFIDDNKNEEALDLYIEMVNYLKIMYETKLNSVEIDTSFAK